MKLKYLFALLPVLFVGAVDAAVEPAPVAYAAAGEVVRNYSTPVSAQDKQNISYIVSTLANTSLPKLYIEQGNLARAGAKVDHLHPLRHLQAILSDDQLKVDFRNIFKRKAVWPSYVDGLTKVFNEELAKGNVQEKDAIDFAQSVKADPKKIVAYVQAANWTGLLENFAKEQGDRRYDQ